MNILVHNHTFFAISEPFVYRQILALAEDHNVSLLSFKFDNADKFPTSAEKHLILHSTGFVDKVITKLLRIAGREDKLSFFTSRKVKGILKNINAIHAQFGPAAINLLPLAKKHNIPLVVTFHGIDASPAMLKDAQYKKDVDKVLEGAAEIIIVSPHMIDTLSLKPCMKKTHLIPCGIDDSYFTPQPKKNDSLIIQHVGRLVPKKGALDLIKVFGRIAKLYPAAKLRVLGDGREMQACRDLVKVLNLESSVELMGAQSQEVVKSNMAEADIYVLNCRTDETGDMEGLPNSILEAMSMEKAVVSTCHAGIPHAITDRVDGLLIPERDNDALLTAIKELIDNPELREALGKQARKTVSSKFSSDITASALRGVFANLRK